MIKLLEISGNLELRNSQVNTEDRNYNYNSLFFFSVINLYDR